MACSIAFVHRLALSLVALLTHQHYVYYNTHMEVYIMRTNIVINDKLIEEAKRLTGLKTKKDIVNLALKELIMRRKQKNLLDIKGKISFIEDYDYKNMREDI